ncbi:MAG: substrate-binding domain-containing protein [Desulfomonilaceae bacterium]|nr:substrate-binding domain-containing protein [Desulfomonilaceae bacterium]
MKRLTSGFTVLSIFLILGGFSYAAEECAGRYGKGPNEFSLATGSPGELGLLKGLAEAFNAKNTTTLCWIKAGSGESLKLLKEKKVDMVMVHAPAAEKKAVSEGWATNRKLIGSNEFFLVGPKDDPAGVAKAVSAADAYAKVAKAGAKFFSRGDGSGTHKKEMAIWERADVSPKGDWYIVTKAFMTDTLRRADKENGYFMTDSSTWVAERKNLPNLTILFRGDKFLVNTYHTLSQPKDTTQGQKWAAQFIDFVASEEGQKIIADYGKDRYGEGLYNDAKYASQYDK